MINTSVKNEGNNPLYKWQINGQDVVSSGATLTTSYLTVGQNLITCSLISNAQPCVYNNGLISNAVNIYVLAGADVDLGPNGTRFIGQQLHPNELKVDADVTINSDNYEFTWQDGSKAPTFMITELCPQDYEVSAKNKQTGCINSSTAILRGFKQDNHSYGGEREEKVYSSVKTFDGGYIMAGYTTSPSNNGDITNNHGQKDMWAIKTNRNGDKEWEASYGGDGDDEAKSIIQTPEDGGYIIAGYTNSQAKEGRPNGDVTINHGGSDIYIVKVNAKGQIIWTNTYGGSNNDAANGIVQLWDNKGNSTGYAIIGSSNSNDWWYAPNNGGNTGSYDMCLMSIDKNGHQIGGWGSLLGGTNNEEGNSLFQTTDGGLIVAGSTTSNDNGIKNHGGNTGTSDVLVYKFDNTGLPQWQRTYGGLDNEAANSIIQTRDLGYILAGEAMATHIGSPTQPITTSYDMWVIKIKPDPAQGDIEWQRTYGGDGNEKANHIIQTQDKGYIVCGSKTTIDDKGGDINYDILKIKADYTNSSGKQIQGEQDWERQIGGNGYDEATTIIEEIGGKGAYTVIGFSASTEGRDGIEIKDHHGREVRDDSYDYWMVQVLTCPEDAPQQNTQKEREVIAALQSGKMLAYPNPAKDGKFIVNLPQSNTNASLEIYNIVGTKILDKQRVNNNQKIDLSNQTKGLYFIKIKTNSKTTTQKLIIE